MMLSAFIIGLFAFQGCQKDDLVNHEDNEALFDLRKGPHSGSVGYVYTIDNDADSNRLLVFERKSDGSLTGPDSYVTGGAGTGGGLGSQGAVIGYEQWVIAVNAGSNQISVFNTEGQTIELVEIDSSYGLMPISLTMRDTFLYVLNAGGDGNIAGFAVNDTGGLEFIAGSQQPLSTNAAGPAQISFDHEGNYLIVTEKATNMITTFPVNEFGVAGPGTAYPSAGTTPFGFDFGHNNVFVVSEASGGAVGESTLSSYQIGWDGSITVLDGPDSTGQSAVCWVVVTNNGKLAYATNTGSDNVTGATLSPHGALELLDEEGVTAESGVAPIDAALARNSKYLYVLNGGDNSITIYSVGNKGNLTEIGLVEGLPDAVVGLAAE